MNEEIDILLSLYFSGEASLNELEQLDKWLSESPDNELYFEEMTKIYQYSGQATTVKEPNVNKAWDSFRQHIHKEEKTDINPVWKKLIPYFSVAASVILLIGIFLFIDSKTNQLNYVTAETPMQQTLFNGVDVDMLAGTELLYDKEMGVTLLKGQATFSVQGTESGNLMVRIGETLIKDIGTVFTVIAHDPDDSITVEVHEGEVLFYTRDNSGIHLKESEKGVYYPSDNYFKHITASIDVKKFKFKDALLPEVIDIISSQYGVEIKIQDEELKNMYLDFYFEPQDSVDDILSIISASIGINVIKESETAYVLSR